MKWLHIADLHLNDQGAESSRMRRGLVEYIKKQNMSIDYIFVAGDLRIGATGVFSSDTAEYLLQLCKVANVSPEKMFIVPGNHDVDRNNLERNAAIMRVLPPGNCKEGYYTPATGIIDNADLLSIKKGETEFIELMTQIYSNIPNRIDAYKSNPPHFSVEADDLNVIHIDSSLVYSKNQTRDLILGTKHLSDVLATVNKNKPTIILTHYSFDFLERSEQNEVFQLLKEAGVKIWISGHEHRNLARLQRNYFHEFQCGNLIIESDTRCCFLFGNWMHYP